MPKITGSLASVNSVPTEGTILLRALELRPGSRFAVTGEPKVAVIRGGKFTIENVEPGPVQLTIQGNGVTHDIRVDVPDVAEVDFLDLLDNVYDWEPAQVSAVKLAARKAREAADEAARIAGAFRGAEQLEGWASESSSARDGAVKAAGEAAVSAKSAKDGAGKAAASEKAAAKSAELAKADAGKAAESAGKAAKSEATAVEAAGHAEGAAGTASVDAERAEKAAGRAEVSEQAAAGSAGKAAQDADRAKTEADRAHRIAGGDFAPTEHTHTVKDITDLPEVTAAPAPNSVPVREYDTMIRVDAHKLPQYPGHLTNKKYVDGAINGVRGEVEVLKMRPAFFSGKGPAPASLPGAVVGDFYFDEEAKELYKITEV